MTTCGQYTISGRPCRRSVRQIGETCHLHRNNPMQLEIPSPPSFDFEQYLISPSVSPPVSPSLSVSPPVSPSLSVSPPVSPQMSSLMSPPTYWNYSVSSFPSSPSSDTTVSTSPPPRTFNHDSIIGVRDGVNYNLEDDPQDYTSIIISLLNEWNSTDVLLYTKVEKYLDPDSTIMGDCPCCMEQVPLIQCGKNPHGTCVPCMKEWLIKGKNTCPMCRNVLIS